MIGMVPLAGNGRVRVVFRRPYSTFADRISVVGEFNDWDSTVTPMIHHRPDTEWIATVELEGGRRSRFRYLLDGKEWLNDWYADDYEHNPYGTCDSVVDLSELGVRSSA